MGWISVEDRLPTLFQWCDATSVNTMKLNQKNLNWEIFLQSKENVGVIGGIAQ